ncbi:MAG TPA: YbdK family carboxylate-amine ligase [Edaphobacter sp.]|uniref:carboxylate-amine ligase n=1 Tax=Edaphobacter sp. TaxID=1934404 RepID=UPI002B810A78|nr:YbdK family carboxylate-amine ligase [Edaphobacter sp.]HUZ93815.1 YbdK family carboxylate-amine ligase [Edaphobacter sp.]
MTAFCNSGDFTLGVELEVHLVDSVSMALVSEAGRIVDELPDSLRNHIRCEFKQCQLEISSGVCDSALEALRDLSVKCEAVAQIARTRGCALCWSGTHPFSHSEEQQMTPSPRYQRLSELLGHDGRQLVVCGLHVHVGVDSAEHAIEVIRKLTSFLPLFLALSCNSPFINGVDTNMLSYRSRLMEAFPTYGLPPALSDWKGYEKYVAQLQELGFIDSPRDLWWIVRPNAKYGTVEVRVCDTPGRLEDAVAISALIKVVVRGIVEGRLDGSIQCSLQANILQQNLWHVRRFGLGAQLFDFTSGKSIRAGTAVERLLTHVSAWASGDDVAPFLARLGMLATQPTWAERQIQKLAETADRRAVVRMLTS